MQNIQTPLEINNRIKALLQSIDISINSLLREVEAKTQEIERLQTENQELKQTSKEVLAKIEEYTLRLEQIKNEHIHNNNNAK